MRATDPQMKIRLPPYLKERLDAYASQADKSLNSTVVEILQNFLGETHVPQFQLANNQTTDPTNRRLLDAELSFVIGRMSAIDRQLRDAFDSFGNLHFEELEDETAEEKRDLRSFYINLVARSSNELESLNDRRKKLEEALEALEEKGLEPKCRT